MDRLTQHRWLLLGPSRSSLFLGCPCGTLQYNTHISAYKSTLMEQHSDALSVAKVQPDNRVSAPDRKPIFQQPANASTSGSYDCGVT